MAQPVSIINSTNQKIDTIYLPDGSRRVKVGIGTYAGAGDAESGAGQLIGTHEASGDTLGAADAVVVVAGVDGTLADPIVPLLVDGTGKPIISTGATDDAAKAVSQEVFPSAFVYDADGSDVLDDGDIGMARVTDDRKVLVVASIRPEAAVVGSGKTSYSLIAAGTTNDTNVKASAGKVFNIFVNNQNAAVRYLKVYDKATAPSNSDTPKLRLAIPPASNVNITFGEAGLEFTLGIGFRLTTGSADNDTGVVTASEHIVNLAYA